MKLLIRLLISIATIFFVYLGICFLGPKNFNIERSTKIDAPVSLIYNEVINLEGWSEWSPWVRADSTMELVFGPIKNGKGASYHWTSEESGQGTMEIVEASTNESMKTRMEMAGWKGYSYGNWNFKTLENHSCKVTWAMESDTDIPFLMRGMMFLNGSSKNLQNNFEEGLADLQFVCDEKMKQITSLEVVRRQVEGRTFLYRKDDVSIAEIAAFYTQNFGILAKATMSEKIEMDGMPSGLYYNWDSANQMTTMAAAIPVHEVFEIQDADFYTFDTSDALVLDFYGPYETLDLAHYAIQWHLLKNDLKVRDPYIEEYMNDPTVVDDPSDIHTQVVYFLETE
jgi:effector-binding domain-containing protein